MRDLALQPDALGVATRLGAPRLRENRVVLEPFLRSAGLSSQIKRMRVSNPRERRYSVEAIEA